MRLAIQIALDIVLAWLICLSIAVAVLATIRMGLDLTPKAAGSRRERVFRPRECRTSRRLRCQRYYDAHRRIG